jgi:hypothetical protein
MKNRYSPYEKITSYEEFKRIPINQLGDIDIDLYDDDDGYIGKWFRQAQEDLYQARCGHLITEESGDIPDELTEEEEKKTTQELIDEALKRRGDHQ